MYANMFPISTAGTLVPFAGCSLPRGGTGKANSTREGPLGLQQKRHKDVNVSDKAVQLYSRRDEECRNVHVICPVRITSVTILASHFLKADIYLCLGFIMKKPNTCISKTHEVPFTWIREPN